MPLAACSSVYSKDSGVLTRSARSSVRSASVIVSAEYQLLLAIFSEKAFSFMRSIEVRCT